MVQNAHITTDIIAREILRLLKDKLDFPVLIGSIGSIDDFVAYKHVAWLKDVKDMEKSLDEYSELYLQRASQLIANYSKHRKAAYLFIEASEVCDSGDVFIMIEFKIQ